jgi:hypothetical protein
MKRSRPSSAAAEREQHPTLETFERVMTSGVIVDRGPGEQHREMWFDVSVAGLDLLAAESETTTYPLPQPGRSKTRSDK